MASRALLASVVLALTIGCGGGQPTPNTAPAPQKNPPAQKAHETRAKPDLAALPPAPELDSTVPPEELLAELEIGERLRGRPGGARGPRRGGAGGR